MLARARKIVFSKRSKNHSTGGIKCGKDREKYGRKLPEKDEG
jgi:hypothetical protein